MSSRILNPRGKSAAQQHSLAPRSGTLEGATVGLLDSTKHNSDVLLAEIGKLLVERYGAKELISRRKPHFGMPAPAELVEELAGQCDVVVTGVGD